MGEPDDTDRTPGTPLATYEELQDIALAEYPGLVANTVIERGPGDAPRNLRVFFVDGGFLDIWLSAEKYSYHWQSDDGYVRFDNAPHHDQIDTHPHHCHEGDNVSASPLDGVPVNDFRTVMEYIEAGVCRDETRTD